MITEKRQTILDEVRSLKEENAAEHGYCIEAIIAAARKRQEASGHPVIRLPKGNLKDSNRAQPRCDRLLDGPAE